MKKLVIHKIKLELEVMRLNVELMQKILKLLYLVLEPLINFMLQEDRVSAEMLAYTANPSATKIRRAHHLHHLCRPEKNAMLLEALSIATHGTVTVATGSYRSYCSGSYPGYPYDSYGSYGSSVR